MGGYQNNMRVDKKWDPARQMKKGGWAGSNYHRLTPPTYLGTVNVVCIEN